MWSYNETSALETYTTASSVSSSSGSFIAQGGGTFSTTSNATINPGVFTAASWSAIVSYLNSNSGTIRFGQTAQTTFLGGDFRHTRVSTIAGTSTTTSLVSVGNSLETRISQTRSQDGAAAQGTTGSSASASFTNTFTSSATPSSSTVQSLSFGPGNSSGTTVSYGRPGFSSTSISTTNGAGNSGSSSTESSINGNTVFVRTTQGTSTGSFTATILHTSTYNSTTVTSTSAITATSTTTSTRSSTYPVSGTTTGITSTGSSADTVTSTVTSATTSTVTSLQTTSYQFEVKMNTIVLADTTDWPWFVTTTGVSVVSDNAVSFTKTTFTNAGTAVSVAFSSSLIMSTSSSVVTGATFGISRTTTRNPANLTVTQTLPSFSQTTTTSSTRTTSSSSYNIGRPFGVEASLSLSNTTSTVGISYTTSRTTSFSFTRTTTTTNSFATASFTEFTGTTTTQSTFNSTNAIGIVPTTITYSSVATTATFSTFRSTSTSETFSGSDSSNDVALRLTASSTESATGVGISNVGVTVQSFTGTRTFSENSQSSATNPATTGITIGEGYQVWPSVGRSQPIGTNVAATFSLVIPGAAGAFGTTVRTPILYAGTSVVAIAGLTMTSRFDTSDSKAHITYQTSTATSTTTASMAVTGSVPSNLSNTRTASAFGGLGWNSTSSTSFTGSSGVHRATLVDSSSFTTTEISWSAATSFSIAPGQAIGLQAVPIASSSASSTANSMFLNYPRFPVT